MKNKITPNEINRNGALVIPKGATILKLRPGIKHKVKNDAILFSAPPRFSKKEYNGTFNTQNPISKVELTNNNFTVTTKHGFKEKLNVTPTGPIESTTPFIVKKGITIVAHPHERIDAKGQQYLDHNVMKVGIYQSTQTKNNNRESGNGAEFEMTGYMFADDLLALEKFEPSHEPLFSNSGLPELKDIKQTKLADCYLMAALLNILHVEARPQHNAMTTPLDQSTDIPENLVADDSNNQTIVTEEVINLDDDNISESNNTEEDQSTLFGSELIQHMMAKQDDGSIVVRLYHPDTRKPIYVNIDAAWFHMLTKEGNIAKSCGHSYMWVHAIELAFAALGYKENNKYKGAEKNSFQYSLDIGSFASTYGDGGTICTAMRMLTGKRTNYNPISNTIYGESGHILTKINEGTSKGIGYDLNELLSTKFELYLSLSVNEAKEKLIELIKHPDENQDNLTIDPITKINRFLDDNPPSNLNDLYNLIGDKDLYLEYMVASKIAGTKTDKTFMALDPYKTDEKSILTFIDGITILPSDETALNDPAKNNLSSERYLSKDLSAKLKECFKGNYCTYNENLKHLAKRLEESLNNNQLVCLGTHDHLNTDTDGIAPNHAYSLEKIEWVENNNVRFCKLHIRNPWKDTSRQFDLDEESAVIDRNNPVSIITLNELPKFFAGYTVGELPSRNEVAEKQLNQKDECLVKTLTNAAERPFTSLDENHADLIIKELVKGTRKSVLSYFKKQSEDDRISILEKISASIQDKKNDFQASYDEADNYDRSREIALLVRLQNYLTYKNKKSIANAQTYVNDLVKQISMVKNQKQEIDKALSQVTHKSLVDVIKHLKAIKPLNDPIANQVYAAKQFAIYNTFLQSAQNTLKTSLNDRKFRQDKYRFYANFYVNRKYRNTFLKKVRYDIKSFFAKVKPEDQLVKNYKRYQKEKSYLRQDLAYKLRKNEITAASNLNTSQHDVKSLIAASKLSETYAKVEDYIRSKDNEVAKKLKISSDRVDQVSFKNLPDKFVIHIKLKANTGLAGLFKPQGKVLHVCLTKEKMFELAGKQRSIENRAKPQAA